MSLKEDYIYGRQTVKEALVAGNVRKIFLLKGQKGQFIKELSFIAREKRVDIQETDTATFSSLINNSTASGGVAATVSPYHYHNIEEVIDGSGLGNNPLLLVLDHLEDPHNLGALLRTAEAAGVHCVIIPAKRAASVTPAVRKVAAGAAEWLPVVQVNNISQTIDYLKERGFWIYGADGESDLSYDKADWKRSVALVLGSEGKGLSPLIQKKCDLIVSIPMSGRLNSLNVSVAGGILMFEHLRHKP